MKAASLQKTIEDQYADQIAKRILDSQGNLVNDPKLQVVVGVLNIDPSELVER
jgi:hypothetical protein